MSAIPLLSIQPHRARGGPAIQHLAFLRKLDAAHFACHVIIPEGQQLEAEYRAVAASVLTMPQMRSVPRSASPLVLGRYGAEAFALAVQIARYARQRGARLVHTFNEAFPAGPMAARLLRLPSVVQLIGMSIFRPPSVAWMYSHFLDTVADRLVCCQNAIRIRLMDLGVSSAKLDVVYNCVNPDEVRSRAEASPSPKTEPGTLRVGMIGGMDPRKGHLNFVAAAREVCASVPNARFFMVGNVPGQSKYVEKVRQSIASGGLSERCTIVGAVEHAEPWIKSFDIHCIPSVTEALSVAGLEAMALGRPVVATRVDGNPEAVADGQTGLLSAANDPRDLASKLQQLLGDSDRRARMGEAGRARVQQMFTVDVNARRLGAVFSRAVGSPLPADE